MDIYMYMGPILQPVNELTIEILCENSFRCNFDYNDLLRS